MSLTHTNPPEPVAGSFRDPSGRVYDLNGRILRTIARGHLRDFQQVCSTGLFRELADQGTVLPFAGPVEPPRGLADPNIGYVLEVPRLPFVSYPYEWPFSALKAAALLHLDVHLKALDFQITLSDASAYNVQFQGAQPVFIDHLSFRPYGEGELWTGHRQFCEQFLLPLLLRALFGISHNAWNRGAFDGIPLEDFSRLLTWRQYLDRRILTHIVFQSWLQRSAGAHSKEAAHALAGGAGLPLKSLRSLLRTLREWIEPLVPRDRGETVWQSYACTNSYGSEEAQRKRGFIAEFVGQVRPRQLWDLGCNTGAYAEIALKAGAGYVVGFDQDQGALEACFARAGGEGLALQTLYMDAAGPSPSLGWRQAERQGLQERASADGLLALALVHHLAIGRNIPFDSLLDWLMRLAPQGVIEFVPKSDPMVQRLLMLRPDIFPDYHFDFMLRHISRSAEVVKVSSLVPNGRQLVWYRRG